MVALQRDFHVAAQLLKARVADGNSKVASRHVFQFVGFVENHGADLRQDSGIGRILGLLLDGKIGEEQMMVDDDDVALHRPAVHLGDEAAVPGAALLSQAGVGTGVELVPESAGFRKRCQFGLVSRLRDLLPGRDGAVVLDLLQTAEHGLIGKVIQLLAAQIVVASLHVADLELAFAVGEKRLLEKRDILMKELFLQILGSGRNDDSLAGANDGHQVGQRLARAGAGFNDQVTLFFQRLLDRLRHLQLSAAKLVGGMSAREHSAGREELVEGDIPLLGVGNGLGGGRHSLTIISPVWGIARVWVGRSCPPPLNLIFRLFAKV